MYSLWVASRDLMTKELERLEVWIVQFSKNRVDDICDSSIEGVYATEEQAKQVCKRENQDGIRSYENWHYYYEKYIVNHDFVKINSI